MKKCKIIKTWLVVVCCLFSIQFICAETKLNFENEKASIKFSLVAQIQGVFGNGAFWGLAQTYAPTAKYPQTFYWGEGYIKPGMKGSLKITDWFSLYGSLSLIASGTLGNDYFIYGTAGAVKISDASLGMHFNDKSGRFWADISAGMQPFSIGSGFILYNGGANGFERGALLLSPYSSWKKTGIVALGYTDFSTRGFYLENDTLAGQTSDKIVGAAIEWSPESTIYIGLAYLQVIESSFIYPTLMPGVFIDNGRQGLNVFDLYWKYETNTGVLAGISFNGEAVLQFKTSIKMLAYGIGVEAGYRFLKVPFVPRVSYLVSYTSGAEKGSSMYNRFDGLYWNGSPTGWASGANASMSFINSNLFFQRIKIEANFTAKDFFSVSYYYIMAAQTNSPLQFGQTGRYNSTIGGIVLGVSSPALASDIYLEYTHMFTTNLFIIGGFAVSIPDVGLREISNDSTVWTGGFISLMVKY